MKMRCAAVPLTAVLALSGCFSTTYVAKSVQPSTVKVEKDMTFLWWGLSGTGHVDVAQTCGGRGAARINTQNTFGQGLMGVITLGIYVPRTAFITCGQ